MQRELIKDLKRSVDDNSNRLLELLQALNNTTNQHQEGFERLNSILSSLQGSQRHVESGLESFDRFRADEERQFILDWISPTEFVSEQNDFIGRRQPGTCQWLLESVKFKEWLKSKNQTLLCPGIPGAGKTILVSVVVDHLCAHFKDEEVGIAYLYCDFKRQDEQTPQNLLASMLRQLIQGKRSINSHITDIFNAHKKSKISLSIRTISKALEIVASSYSKVFVVVDAIDELETSTGSQHMFLTQLFSIKANASCCMNIFATSRALPEIVDRFKDGIVLEIRATEQDVDRYVTAHMSSLPSFVRHNLKLQEEVRTELARYFDGMYGSNYPRGF